MIGVGRGEEVVVLATMYVRIGISTLSPCVVSIINILLVCGLGGVLGEGD